MGYESRVIIVKRSEYPKNNLVIAEELARVNLCCMGYSSMYRGASFREIFKTPIDFNLYGMPERWEDPEELYPDEHYREDCYGKHCGMTTIDKVIEWLERAVDKDGETILTYRRAKLLYGILNHFKAMEKDFGSIYAVHYGY